MKKRILTQIVLLLLVAIMCMLSSCNMEQFRGEQGATGEKGDTGATGNGIASITTEKVDGGTKVIIQYTDSSMPNVEFIIPDGEKGEQGDKGDKGDQGIKGDTGTGVSKVEIIEDKLVITLSDTTVINLGNIKGDKGNKGEQGEHGVSITAVTLTVDGDLSMTFSSGETIPLGNIKGQDGVDGVGIAEVYIEDGNLYVRKTNETVAVNLGSVKGPKGDKGDQGEQGPKGDKGDKGDTGRGIAKTEIINGHLWITYTDDLENPVDLGKVTEPKYEGTDGLAFYPLPDGTYGVMAGTTLYLEEVIIPSVYNGKAVTRILPYAFENSSINTVTIPNSITVIDKYAFHSSKLKTVTIPESVIEIGAYAFYGTPITDVYFEDPEIWNVTYSYYSNYSKESGKTIREYFDLSNSNTAADLFTTTIKVLSYKQYSGGSNYNYFYNSYDYFARVWKKIG